MPKIYPNFLIAIFLIFVLVALNLVFPPQPVFAATNIDSTYRYAWNDVIGWIDFYSTGNINVTLAQLTGYATSSVGYIVLDCATSPNGNICGISNFKVSNDGNGNLSGWAYNDAIGWISFNSVTAGSSYFYQVAINPTTGDFSGWAWNDIIGWISFNCVQPDVCATSNYKVKTSWSSTSLEASLISSIFDTGVSNGAGLNSLTWQGNKPSGTDVKFQIASAADSTGPWEYKGWDGSISSYYTPQDAGIPIQINPAYHNNYRYFRYKIFLYSDAGQTLSPRVDDVIINWSP